MSKQSIVSTMMATPLSLNHFLERAGHLFPNSEIVSRLPNKNLKKHSFKQYYDRTLQLASALKALGLNKGIIMCIWKRILGFRPQAV
jgi:fatty-acyl-CoA synthase